MSESFDKAVEAAHAAICEDSLSDCLDLDRGGGKCYRAVLAALPHLTAEDVPHLIRRAWAEAWEVGRSMGLSDHSASMRAGRPLRSPNPYAEETTDDHA